MSKPCRNINARYFLVSPVFTELFNKVWGMKNVTHFCHLRKNRSVRFDSSVATVLVASRGLQV
jgi:hypothetical protein